MHCNSISFEVKHPEPHRSSRFHDHRIGRNRQYNCVRLMNSYSMTSLFIITFPHCLHTNDQKYITVPLYLSNKERDICRLQTCYYFFILIPRVLDSTSALITLQCELVKYYRLPVLARVRNV